MIMSSNFLNDGTILPSGLMGDSGQAIIDAFNKTYRNYPLRVGVVIKAYSISDPGNRSKLATEYDVTCIEQNENYGVTTITYKNCIATSGLGSIADFFEKSFRPLMHKTYKSDAIRFSGQDGSVVLLLCMDASSEKALIIGGFPHPNRPTTITTTSPKLEGEYNGVNISVQNDGSTSLVFNGATDSYGNPVTPGQGPTTVSIATDGSFQVQHSTITFNLAKSGIVTIQASGNINVNCANATVTSTGTSIVDGQTVKLGASATESVIKGDTFKQLFDAHEHPTPIGPTGPPVQPLDQSALSTIVKTQ